MSITLELTQVEEEALRAEAAAQEMDFAAYVRLKVLAGVSPCADEGLRSDALFLQEEGTRAVRAAQDTLLKQGIGYVTGDEATVTVHTASSQE